MFHLTKRFESAVRALVGDGPIKQRLGEAYAAYLADLSAPDFPDAFRDRFDALQCAMHSASPIGKENSLRVTVRKMSFAEAAQHAAVIVDLYVDLVRNAERVVEPLKVVRSEEPPPRYLVARS